MDCKILRTEDGIAQSAAVENGKLSAQEGKRFETDSPDESEPFQISPEKSATSDKIGDLVAPKMICDIQILQPNSLLPKPEAPKGLLLNSPVQNDDVSNQEPMYPPENFAAVDMPAIGKFIRERSNSFSAAIAKKLSSFKENLDDPSPKAMAKRSVTEFNLSGLRVIVKLKNDEEEKLPEKDAIKGRISFFSRSNCRDCTAVRRFFREKGLRFVEINVDVYPRREKELVARTGSSSVPHIFFNEKLFGGLVALNSLRNSGDFDRRLREMAGPKCPDDAPSPPVYGFDDDESEEEEEKESTDEIVRIVRVLRQRLPIQDRLMKMKIVKNCFAGWEMVEAVIHHLDCGRRKVRTRLFFSLILCVAVYCNKWSRGSKVH